MFLVGTILVAFLSPPSSLWLLFTFCFPSLGNEPFLPRAHLFALSTELNTITGGWLDQLWEPFIKVRKFEPIHRKVKVTFKAIIDETSFWESPSPQTVLPLYSTSPITLKSNLNEVRSWNVVEIATKCEIKQPARLLLSLSLKHLKLPSVWKSNFKSFLIYVVGIMVKFR